MMADQFQPRDRGLAWVNQGEIMNQQIQKRQASALDRVKVALAHGARRHCPLRSRNRVEHGWGRLNFVC